MDKSALIS